MLKLTTFMFGFLLAICSVGQQVISSAGTTFSKQQASISFTIGEPVITTEVSGNVMLTQGFHQSKWSTVNIANYDKNFHISVFPNPTRDVLTIKTTKYEMVDYAIYNVQGQVVVQGRLTGIQTVMPVAHLLPGSYVVTLIKDSNILQTIRLVKTP